MFLFAGTRTARSRHRRWFIGLRTMPTNSSISELVSSPSDVCRSISQLSNLAQYSFGYSVAYIFGSSKAKQSKTKEVFDEGAGCSLYALQIT